MEPLNFPARISVEVTNRCNQKCRLCPREGFTRSLGLMQRAVFERIVAEVAAHHTVMWLHFLGEPLLHPQLVEFVRLATERGVASVGLSTNAALLDTTLRTGLMEAGLDRLDCSLDAVEPIGYTAMRGTDDFDSATGNVRAFLAERNAAGRDRPAVGLQFMEVGDHDEVLDAARRIWGPLLGPRDFIKSIAPATFGGVVVDGTRAPSRTERWPCEWLFRSLMVLQDGTVTMCGADWDAAAPLGSVVDSSIIDIWHGEEIQRRRAAHLEARFGDVPLCGPCNDWYLSDGHGYVNSTRATAPATSVGIGRKRSVGPDQPEAEAPLRGS